MHKSRKKPSPCDKSRYSIRVFRALASTVSVNLQQKMLHREFWIQLVMERALPLAIPLLAWLSIFEFAQTEALSGWSKSGMIAYYLLVFVIGLFTDIQFHYEMSQMVHMGTLTQWLIRPLTFLEMVISHIIARLVLLILPGVVLLLLGLWLIPGALHALTFSLLGRSLLVLPLSLVLFSLLSVSVGMLSFWVIKTDSVFALLMLVLEFFGGRLLPLELLPSWLQKVSFFLPMRFAIAGPVEAILQPQTISLYSLLLGQITWCVLLFAAVAFIWRAGIRHYDAVGG